VKDARPSTFPNEGFMFQLHSYHARLRGLPQPTRNPPEIKEKEKEKEKEFINGEEVIDATGGDQSPASKLQEDMEKAILSAMTKTNDQTQGESTEKQTEEKQLKLSSPTSSSSSSSATAETTSTSASTPTEMNVHNLY